MNKQPLFVALAAFLVCGLEHTLSLGIRVSAAESQTATAPLIPVALRTEDLSGLAQTWNPGVVTYTFDLDSMDRRSRDAFIVAIGPGWAQR